MWGIASVANAYWAVVYDELPRIPNTDTQFW